MRLDDVMKDNKGGAGRKTRHESKKENRTDNDTTEPNSTYDRKANMLCEVGIKVQTPDDGGVVHCVLYFLFPFWQGRKRTFSTSHAANLARSMGRIRAPFSKVMLARLTLPHATTNDSASSLLALSSSSWSSLGKMRSLSAFCVRICDKRNVEVCRVQNEKSRANATAHVKTLLPACDTKMPVVVEYSRFSIFLALRTLMSYTHKSISWALADGAAEALPEAAADALPFAAAGRAACDLAGGLLLGVFGVSLVIYFKTVT